MGYRHIRVTQPPIRASFYAEVELRTLPCPVPAPTVPCWNVLLRSHAQTHIPQQTRNEVAQVIVSAHSRRAPLAPEPMMSMRIQVLRATPSLNLFV